MLDTDFGARRTPGAGFRRKTSEFGGPGTTFDAGHEKTHFSELAVFSAFCTKNGVVTKTGDIGKTFSWLENFAVLQCLGTKIQNLNGWYRPSFLTTYLQLKARAKHLKISPTGRTQSFTRSFILSFDVEDSCCNPQLVEYISPLALVYQQTDVEVEPFAV